MGEAMDHQMEVMEKMRKRLEWETGDSISLDEIDPDEAWNEEFASWKEGNGSYCYESNSNNLEVDFEVGDTVKLNSSDIFMTIKSIDANILTCRWFDKNNTLQSEKFNALELSLTNKVQNNDFSHDEDEIPF